MGLHAAGDKDSNAQGIMTKEGSINQENSLLANAPILRSILKKVVRTVPSKNKNTSKSTVNFVVSNVSGFNDKNSTLLADAPILKSILKKAVRTVPGKNNNNSKSNVNFVVSNDSNVVPTYDSNVRIGTSDSYVSLSVGQQGDDEEGSLVSGIADKVKNVDGTILGRDSKVLKPCRMVTFADQVEGLPTEQQKEGVAGHGRSDGVGKAAPSTQVAHNSQGSPNSTLNQPLNKTVDSGNINDEGKSSSEELCMRVFKGWDWTSNGNFCSSGSRIILGWNVDVVDLNVVAMSDQVIHTFVRFKADKKELFCSFVYAHNKYTHRRPLWDNLGLHNQLVCNRPWCVLGDFNSALNLEDKIEGSSVIDIAMLEFKECVDANELVVINRSGLQFTWTQKPRGFDGTLIFLRRVNLNLDLLNSLIFWFRIHGLNSKFKSVGVHR
ncbi:RNA-directed DNA polymerase, eukaryota, Reverse transcriptase zinc-binding domain protein [Artemisia annua]|uniref:RNA-directed DNA polymerase, eukaryota, Reverse transcriptase zinc-binding domain protein n=1 Tax=Artemisia annua TaxID=35608 RepID=A0A2U1L6C6_ARTAN|nr:RNA-directed DNA polymerase, eukaryota, Reverse transcriptase zinc-binding domain protein [Artemisia annua]